LLFTAHGGTFSALTEAKKAYVIPESEIETAACEISAATSASIASTPTSSTPACTIEQTIIFVLGIVTGERYYRKPRSDTIMLYSIQPCKSYIVEVSITKDLRVEIPGYQTTNTNRAFNVGKAYLSEITV